MEAEKPKVNLVLAEKLTEEVIAEVDNLFEYHPWDEEQKCAGQVVRSVLADAYKQILKWVPPCPTRTRALNKLVDARMDCNAAITHRGRY